MTDTRRTSHWAPEMARDKAESTSMPFPTRRSPAAPHIEVHLT